MHVCTTTCACVDAEVKGLCGIYHRVLLVPRPDYASRVILWKQFIVRETSLITELDFSSLAKVTDGYTPGHIRTAVATVLTERRIQQVSGIWCVHVRVCVCTPYVSAYVRCGDPFTG